MKTKLSSFDFKLPEELIAKYPAKERDESKLMVIHKESGKIEHKQFKDVIDYYTRASSGQFIPSISVPIGLIAN